MDLARTPLLDQSPVPIDWPTRIGYPPPGITRMVAYPAGGPPDPKNPKRSVDAIYPHSASKIAKAHAWMFPSKRIKLLGKRKGRKGRKRHARIFRESVDYAGELDRAMKTHGLVHPKTISALKAAAANMEALPVAHQKRVRLALALTVGRQVRQDATSGTRWRDTASVDFDIKRALIEGLAKARGQSAPRPPHVYASYLPHESDSFESDDPLPGRHVFSKENDRNSFMKGAKAHYTVEPRRVSGGLHMALVSRKKRSYSDLERNAIYGSPRDLRRRT